MTDKQLALLLRNIAIRVQVLADEVSSLIETGPREFKRIWIGEGEEPAPPPPSVNVAYFSYGQADKSDVHPYHDKHNWEEQPVGELLAVRAIEALADDLKDEADELANGQSV